MHPSISIPTQKPIGRCQLVYVPRTQSGTSSTGTGGDKAPPSHLNRSAHIPSLLSPSTRSPVRYNFTASKERSPLSSLETFSNAYLWVSHPDRTISIYNFSTGALVASIAALLSDITLIYGYDHGVFIGCANGYVYQFSHAWDTESGTPVRPKLAFIYSRGVDDSVSKYVTNAESNVLHEINDPNRDRKKRVTTKASTTAAPKPRTDFVIHNPYSEVFKTPNYTSIQSAMYSVPLKGLILQLPLGAFLFSPQLIAGDSALLSKPSSLKSAFRYLPTLTAPIGVNQGHEGHSYAQHRYHQLLSSNPSAASSLSLPATGAPPRPVYLLTQCELFSIEGQGCVRCLYRFYDCPVTEVYDALRASPMLALIDAAQPTTANELGQAHSQSHRHSTPITHLNDTFKYIITQDGFIVAMRVLSTKATVHASTAVLQNHLRAKGVQLSHALLLTYSVNTTYIACISKDYTQVFVVAVSTSHPDTAAEPVVHVTTINHYTFPVAMYFAPVPLHIQPASQLPLQSQPSSSSSGSNDGDRLQLRPLLLTSAKPSSHPTLATAESDVCVTRLNIISIPIPSSTHVPTAGLIVEPVTTHDAVDLQSTVHLGDNTQLFSPDDKSPESPALQSHPRDTTKLPALLQPTQQLSPHLQSPTTDANDISTLSYLTPIKRPSAAQQQRLLDLVRKTTPSTDVDQKLHDKYLKQIQSLQEEVEQLKQHHEQVEGLTRTVEQEREQTKAQSATIADLTTQLEKTRDELNTVQQQLHSAQSQLADTTATKSDADNQLQEQIDALNMTIQTLRDEIASLQSAKDELEKELTASQSRCQELSQQLQDAKQASEEETASIQQKYDTLHQELEAVKEQYQSKCEEVALLQSEHSSQDDVFGELVALRQEHQALTVQLQKEITQHELVQSEFDTLSQHLETLLQEKATEADSLRETVEDLQHENESLLQSLEEYVDQIQQLEQQCDDLEFAKEELTMQMNVSKSLQTTAEEQYKTSLDEVSNHVSDLTKTLEQLRERETSLTEQLEHITNEYETLKDDHQTSLATIAAAATSTAILHDLRHQLDLSQQLYIDLEDQHRRLVQESRDQHELTVFLSEQQKRQLADAEDEVRRLTHDNEHYIKAYGAKEEEYALLHDEYTKFHDKCTQLEDKATALTTELGEVQQQLAEAQAQLAKAASGSSSTDLELQELKEKQVEMETAVASKSETIESQAQAIADLTQQLEQAQNDSKDAQAKHEEEMSQLKTSYEEQVQRLQADADALRTENESLTAQITAAQQQLEDTSKSDTSTQQAIDDLQQELNKARGTMEALEMEKKLAEFAKVAASQETEDLRQQLDDKREECISLKEQRDADEELTKERLQDMEQLKSDLEAQKRQVGALHHDLQRQTKDYTSLSQRYEQTSSQLKTLLQNFHELFVASQSERNRMLALQGEADTMRKQLADLILLINTFEQRHEKQQKLQAQQSAS